MKHYWNLITYGELNTLWMCTRCGMVRMDVRISTTLLHKYYSPMITEDKLISSMDEGTCPKEGGDV